MDTSFINLRYSGLAKESCCLSCGNAINFAEPKEGECCIDLGSGRGTDVFRMAESVGDSGHVYGIDISEGMIDAAEINAKKLELANVTFIKSELEQLYLPDKIADLVISNCTINHSSDKIKVWNEIYRVLKPEGRFVVSDIYSIEPVPEQYKNDPVAVSECWAGAITRKEYLNTLQSSGFKEIAILEESEPYLKGKIKVAGFTIFGKKQNKCCCCS